MNRKEAAAMAEGNPYSFLHICRAEIDMPEQEIKAEYENNTTKIQVPDMGAWEMLLLLVE